MGEPKNGCATGPCYPGEIGGRRLGGPALAHWRHGKKSPHFEKKTVCKGIGEARRKRCGGRTVGAREVCRAKTCYGRAEESKEKDAPEKSNWPVQRNWFGLQDSAESVGVGENLMSDRGVRKQHRPWHIGVLSSKKNRGKEKQGNGPEADKTWGKRRKAGFRKHLPI